MWAAFSCGKFGGILAYVLTIPRSIFVVVARSAGAPITKL
jgi:hypothetical protein